MKKFITLLFALILMSVSLSAQVGYTKPEKKSMESIDGPKAGIWMQRWIETDTYQLCILSTNRFDDAFYLTLGRGKQAAITSLTNILKMMDDTEIDGAFDVGPCYFHKETATKFWTGGGSRMHSAGWYYLSVSDVKALIEILKKK